MTRSSNPLLENYRLPPFSRIKPEDIRPAIETLIEQNRTSVNRLTQQDRIDWDNLVKPLALMDDHLSRVWSPVRHLNSVKSTDEWMRRRNAQVAKRA